LSATVYRRATHVIPGLTPCGRLLIILPETPETARRIPHAIRLLYMPHLRDTMNWVQPNYTPLTAFTHPFSFPAITSAGVATAFPSLVPSTVLRCASGNTRISCLRGHAATGPCTQRRPGLSCVPPSAGAGRGGEIVASCPGMPSNR
jgi:hypothetical protein